MVPDPERSAASRPVAARLRPAAWPERPSWWRRRAAWLALALVAAAWLALRALPTRWIDGPWSTGWLPLASRLSATAIDVVPPSLTAVSGLLLFGLLGWLVHGGRRPGRRHRLLWAAAIVLGLGPAFELAWGMAYRRSPIEVRLGLPAGAPATESTWRALERLLDVARAHAPRDPARVRVDAPWWDDALRSGSACLARVDAYVSGRPEPLRLPTRLRRLPAGTLLTAGFAGVQAPWWREPHVDGGLPPVAALATAMHELAHTAGWAREAETDALATLAGLACPDPDVRFAMALHGLLLVRAELVRLPHPDPDWRRRLDARWAELPPVATAAWSAASEALARHRAPAVERAAGAAYDAYLRAHGVTAGLADYGRAGTVLVAALDGCGTAPAAPWCAR